MSKESVQKLLSAPIDPTSPTLWTDFKKSLLRSRPSALDRRAVMNLKLMFNGIWCDGEKLSVFAQFLRTFSKSFTKDELSGEIGFVISKVLTSGKITKCEHELTDFIKSAGFMCSCNPVMRKRLFEETIDDFSRALRSGISLPSVILIALFELEITMISQCPENWQIMERIISPDHIKMCMRLIESTPDSLAQMLISEWMWRVKNRLAMTPIIDQVLRDFGPLFNEISISAGNFRASLHEFIRAVNQKRKTGVVHSEFQELAMNATNLGCSGWIDINQSAMVVWLFQKPEQMPDVVVFRAKHISKAVADTDKLSFATNERLSVFDQFTKERPLQFEFQTSCSKPFMTELAKLCPLTIPKKSPQNPRAARTYASKSRPVLEDIDKSKDVSFDQIQKQITDFHETSKRSIEDFRDRVTDELHEIISRASEQKKLLAQFAQQHRQLADSTTSENQQIARTVSTLEKEFETRHDGTMKNRESIMTNTLQDIAQLKQQFIEETNLAFEQNAIVGFCNNLANLQEVLSTV